MTIARFLRLAVAVSLTAYVLWRARPVEVTRAADISYRWIRAAIGPVLLDRTRMAYRWMVVASLASALIAGGGLLYAFGSTFEKPEAPAS